MAAVTRDVADNDGSVTHVPVSGEMAVSKPVANPMLAAAEVDDETPADDAADHPDDGGPSNSDNKPPVVLADWLRRVGDLLSTPSGEPTALYKALMIPLVCGPLGFPSGAFAPVYPNVLVAIADDDMEGPSPERASASLRCSKVFSRCARSGWRHAMVACCSSWALGQP